ncbi:MAG TPA: hypothetical protein VFQ85_00810 [Mycobacteriales bacterium]|nr:hypothetical protein [Mycobacteriales bacterium]
MRPGPLATAVALCCALAGCTGESPEPTAAPTTPAVPTATDTGPHCPAPTRPAAAWPKSVPEVIPKPAGLVIQKTDTSKGNIIQVRSQVPISLRESVLFIVKEFPKAGFTLSRGDAEATEADAPFQRGDALRGLVRVFATDDPCSTLWLYAVVRNTNAPYDISYTPPPSSTPLPFG